MLDNRTEIKKIIKKMYKEGKMKYYEVAFVLTAFLLKGKITPLEFKAILMEIFENDYSLIFVSLCFSKILIDEKVIRWIEGIEY